IFDGSHRTQHLTGMVNLPILVLKCFVREKQVLPVLHVGERVTRQRVLLIARRQITSQSMTSPKYGRLNFDQRQEMPARIAEKVGIEDAAVLSGHNEQIVRPDCPMETAVLH